MTTYLRDSEGKFIPATQRPDGTWRKARRIKEGYVPQEEVPLYESKGKKFQERRQALYPPGFSPNGIDPLKKEREELLKAKTKLQKPSDIIKLLSKPPAVTAAATSSSAAVATNSVQKSSKQKKKSNSNTTTTATANPDDIVKLSNNLNAISLSATAAATTISDDGMQQQQQIVKQLKKLRKKMREIEAIEEKLRNGGLKNPEPDQLVKVKRKAEIQKEIDRLVIEEQQFAASI